MGDIQPIFVKLNIPNCKQTILFKFQQNFFLQLQITWVNFEQILTFVIKNILNAKVCIINSQKLYYMIFQIIPYTFGESKLYKLKKCKTYHCSQITYCINSITQVKSNQV